MALITVEDAQTWLDKNKLALDILDADLESQASTHVLGRLASVYDVVTWLTPATTPDLVRSVTAMYYSGWHFVRTYSEDSDGYGYGLFLIRMSDSLLDGLVSGAIDIIEVEGNIGSKSGPAFYPTDASSALEPEPDDLSLGGPVFSMGRTW